MVKSTRSKFSCKLFIILDFQINPKDVVVQHYRSSYLLKAKTIHRIQLNFVMFVFSCIYPIYTEVTKIINYLSLFFLWRFPLPIITYSTIYPTLCVCFSRMLSFLFFKCTITRIITSIKNLFEIITKVYLKWKLKEERAKINKNLQHIFKNFTFMSFVA